MIKNFNKLKTLVKLGLTEKEARIFNALLYRKVATTTELKKLSRVPDNKIYDVLAKMVNDGLIVVTNSSTVRSYSISNPRNSLEPLCVELENYVEEGRLLLAEAIDLYENGSSKLRPQEFIETLHGNEIIMRKYQELLNNSVDELFAIAKPPYSSNSKESTKLTAEAFRKFIERGCKTKAIFEVNDTPDKITLYQIQDSHERNENFRIARNLPPKMVIFDKKLLLTMDIDRYSENHEFTSVLIRDRTTVNFYYNMLEKLWDESLTYEQWVESLDEPYPHLSIDDLY
jgi:HTH-type transcriptional regulator, sugar sensing transcriptional regulator